MKHAIFFFLVTSLPAQASAYGQRGVLLRLSVAHDQDHRAVRSRWRQRFYCAPGRKCVVGALGQAGHVENKAGAGSTLGASYALKSPADGYTLLLISSSYAITPLSTAT